MILVLLLVTAIAVGASAWYAGNRAPPVFDPAGRASAPAPSSSPAPATSSGPTPTAIHPAVLAFYGDWFVSGTAQGGTGEAGWPAVVSRGVGAEATEPHAVTDAGYVRPSQVTGDTFATLAEKDSEPTADVTIVFGGRNDYRAGAAEVTAGATRTLQAIRAADPRTQLLVIGPAWIDADVPPELPPVRDAVQRAASAAGATFVDPLAEGWVLDRPGLIGRDGLSPTDKGHVYLADRIEPVVRQLLAKDPAISLAPGPLDRRRADNRAFGSLHPTG